MDSTTRAHSLDSAIHTFCRLYKEHHFLMIGAFDLEEYSLKSRHPLSRHNLVRVF